MQNLVYLRDIVVILVAAIIVVSVFYRFKIPAIAGFILAGMLIGPGGLALVNDVHQVEILAEVGVALLLFGIGMELSLARLRRFWRLALLGGFLQVGISIVVSLVIARHFGLETPTALFVGFIVAISSTAIVLRGLEQRGEVDAPHGRLTLGILIFQDLCVVPMMLAIPLLAGSGASLSDMFSTLGRSVLILIAVLIAARIIIPRLMDFIAATRQRYLFILSVFVISVGTAWVATLAGVSLALGAFLAGLVVADSEYRHQALADLTAFREIFTSIFFVSVGMLLSPLSLMQNISIIVILLAVILFGKFLVVFITGLTMQLTFRVAILAAAALSQIGEFSFILMSAARGTGLLPAELESSLMAVAILSMLITPFGLAAGPHLAAGVGRLRILNRMMRVATAQEAGKEAGRLKDHVIIGGYGFAGQQLACSLTKCEIPFIIVELNIENVRRARANNHRAFFGDITSPEVLGLVGIDRASEIVIVINDPSATERVIKAVRRLMPGIHIVARTNYLQDIGILQKAGANLVIPAEREAAVEVTSQILGRHFIDAKMIIEECQLIRNQSK